MAERGAWNEVDVDYFIVRLVSRSKLYREEQDQSLRAKFRTECWLERCIFEERLCPDEMTAQANNARAKTWVFQEEHALRKKGVGRGILETQQPTSPRTLPASC